MYRILCPHGDLFRPSTHPTIFLFGNSCYIGRTVLKISPSVRTCDKEFYILDKCKRDINKQRFHITSFPSCAYLSLQNDREIVCHAHVSFFICYVFVLKILI